ncbi:MAG: CheY-like chemotaxis protein [Bacteroidia bacterium]|jgi:CheY-like chemotaxis protein
MINLIITQKAESYFTRCLSQVMSYIKSKSTNAEFLKLTQSHKKLVVEHHTLTDNFNEKMVFEKEKYNSLLNAVKKNEKLNNLNKNADFKILLIEDFPEFREQFRNIIEDAFSCLNLTVSIVETDNINDAELLCRSNEFNLIVTDLYIIDGCMSEVLIEHQRFITENIFIVSASSEECFKNSFHYKKWLSKVFDVDMMKNSIVEIQSQLQTEKEL